MDVSIRLYGTADQQALIRLWTEVLPDTARHNDAATSLENKLSFDRRHILVATTATGIVGAVIGAYDGHRGWIYSLAVAESSRRNGVGTLLVRAAERLLADLGCLKLNLQVRTTNSAVVSFYQKLGYEVEERISMGKRLYTD